MSDPNLNPQPLPPQQPQQPQQPQYGAYQQPQQAGYNTMSIVAFILAFFVSIVGIILRAGPWPRTGRRDHRLRGGRHRHPRHHLRADRDRHRGVAGKHDLLSTGFVTNHDIRGTNVDIRHESQPATRKTPRGVLRTRRGVFRRGLLAEVLVARVELLDAAGRVEDALLARVERVRLRRDLDVDDGGRPPTRSSSRWSRWSGSGTSHPRPGRGKPRGRSRGGCQSS